MDDADWEQLMPYGAGVPLKPHEREMVVRGRVVAREAEPRRGLITGVMSHHVSAAVAARMNNGEL